MENAMLNEVNNFIEYALEYKKEIISSRNIELIEKLNVQSYFYLHNSLLFPKYKSLPIHKETTRVTELEQEIHEWTDFLNRYHKIDSVLWKKIKETKNSVIADTLSKEVLEEIVKLQQELQDLQAFLEKNYSKLLLDRQQKDLYRNRTLYLTTIINDYIRTRHHWQQNSAAQFEFLVPVKQKEFSVGYAFKILFKFFISWFITDLDIEKAQIERNKLAKEKLAIHQSNHKLKEPHPDNTLSKQLEKAENVKSAYPMTSVVSQTDNHANVQQTISIHNLKDELNKILSSEPRNATYLNLKRRVAACNDLSQLITLAKEIKNTLDEKQDAKANTSHGKLATLCQKIIDPEYYIREEIQQILQSEPKNRFYLNLERKIRDCNNLAEIIDLLLEIINELHKKDRNKLTVSDEKLVSLCYRIINSDSSKFSWLKYSIKKAENVINRLFSELAEAEKNKDASLYQRKKSSIEAYIATLKLRYEKLNLAKAKILYRLFDVHDKFKARLNQLDTLIKISTEVLRLENYREDRKNDISLVVHDMMNQSSIAPDTKRNRLDSANTVKELVLKTHSPDEYSQLFSNLSKAIKDIKTKDSRFLKLLVAINNTLFEILNNKYALTHKDEKKQQIAMSLLKSELIFLENCLGALAKLRNSQQKSDTNSKQEIVRSNSRDYRTLRNSVPKGMTPEVALQKFEGIVNNYFDHYRNNNYTRMIRNEYTHIRTFLDYLDTYQEDFKTGKSFEVINRMIDEAKLLYHSIQYEEIKLNLRRFIKTLGMRHINIATLPNGFIHFDNASKMSLIKKMNTFGNPKSILTTRRKVAIPQFDSDVSLREFCTTLSTQIDIFMTANHVLASNMITPSSTLFQTATLTIGSAIGSVAGKAGSILFEGAAALNRTIQLNTAENVAGKVQSLDKISPHARLLAQTITKMYWYQLKKIVDPLSYYTLIECFMERITAYFNSDEWQTLGTMDHFIKSIWKMGIYHEVTLGLGQKTVALQNSKNIKAWELIQHAPVMFVNKGDKFILYRNRHSLLELGPVLMPSPPNNFWVITEEYEKTVVLPDGLDQYKREYNEVRKEVDDFYQNAEHPALSQ